MVVRPKLTKILRERGMTQAELSEATGIPQGSISRFDKNERHTAWHLFAISRALNVPIEELFEVRD